MIQNKIYKNNFKNVLMSLSFCFSDTEIPFVLKVADNQNGKNSEVYIKM